VIGPRIRCPGMNLPDNLVPNHSPNCAGSVKARQTFERGAFRTMLFWIRSVLAPADDSLLVLIGNLLVAHILTCAPRKRNRWVA
jgi:hypothetical protein